MIYTLRVEGIPVFFFLLSAEYILFNLAYLVSVLFLVQGGMEKNFLVEEKVVLSLFFSCLLGYFFNCDGLNPRGSNLGSFL